MDDVNKLVEKIKKLENLLEKLTGLYYESQRIMGEDDNDLSRVISSTEDELIRVIDWEKRQLKILPRSELDIKKQQLIAKHN